jgi:hypothetical protein
MSKQPRVLYRYRPMSETLPAEIEFNVAYFCPLDSLNDKLEGNFDYLPSSPEELRNTLIEKARSDNEFEFAAILEVLPETAFREIERESKKIGAPEMNARKNWGVVCFTERFNNQRMWDRYANAGKGVVIEFDLSSVLIPAGALWKVRYSHERGSTSVVRVLTSRVEGEFSEALIYKTPDWSYEEEWRLLANRQGLYKIEIPISRVILGHGLSITDKNRLTNAIVRNGRPRLAELIPSGTPEKFMLHDRISGDNEIEFI